MKNLFSILSIAVALSTVTLSPSLFAKDKPTAEELAARKVPAALANLEPLSGDFNTKADYYIYLSSASWCGPCVALMPKVAKEYSKLKRKKIELILVCADKTEEDAKNYVKKYKAKFPMVMTSQGGKLPGFAGGGAIPNATIVDAEGNEIKKGHGSIILEWKDVIKDHEKALLKEKRAAERAAKNEES